MTETPEDVKRIIRERSDLFEKHFRDGNAKGLVADYYTDQPVMSAPDMAPIKGHAGITALFEALVGDFAACTLEQVEVSYFDDTALEISRAVLVSKDADTPDTQCRYMIVWRRMPDTWRVEADFFAYGTIL